MKFNDKFDSARPYVACFVILRKGTKIAMVLRKNTGWMDGLYGLPAGKVEYGETYLQAVIREAKEEAGVDISPEDLSFVHMVHRHGDEGGGMFMDWIDVYFEASKWEGEPYNAEEHKSERLDWLEPSKHAAEIVPAQYSAIDHALNKRPYSEYGW